jgi:hypothetical protein
MSLPRMSSRKELKRQRNKERLQRRPQDKKSLQNKKQLLKW